MEQEDYIKRQIDQIGRVLGKILADLYGLKNQGLTLERIELYSHAISDELGLSSVDLASIPPEVFIEKVRSVTALNSENLEKLADVFLLMAGNLPPGTGEEQRRKYNGISLAILEYLDNSSLLYSFDRRSKIMGLKMDSAGDGMNVK